MRGAVEDLHQALGLSGGGVISLVGAGGKTSTMFRLARELHEAGDSVLTTTTTKILMPSQKQSPHVLLCTELETLIGKARRLLPTAGHLSAAALKIETDRPKLSGYAPDFIDRLHAAQLFKWIIIEADGAGRRPLKAPAPHEPVIPACTHWVVSVVGLNALGQPLEDRWVFRPERFARLSGLRETTPITAEAVAKILLHPDGIMKGTPPTAAQVVFLNRADTPERIRQGRQIAAILQDAGTARIRRIVLGKALHRPHVVAYFDRHNRAAPLLCGTPA